MGYSPWGRKELDTTWWLNNSNDKGTNQQKKIFFLQVQSLHFINHRRYFFNESNRDIYCAKADDVYSLKYKHQHRKDIVSVYRAVSNETVALKSWAYR